MIQAIAQKGVYTNSLMPTHSPSLESKIELMMSCMAVPTIRKLWAQQVNSDPRVQYAVLTKTHRIEIIHDAVFVQVSGTTNIIVIGCSGDGIQIGQLVKIHQLF